MIVEQITVEGVSTNINIVCSLGNQEGAPFWYINNTAYELFSIPWKFHFIPVVESYSFLVIPRISLDLNGLVLQCGSFDESGMLILSTSGARINVQPC